MDAYALGTKARSLFSTRYWLDSPSNLGAANGEGTSNVVITADCSMGSTKEFVYRYLHDNCTASFVHVHAWIVLSFLARHAQNDQREWLPALASQFFVGEGVRC